MSKRLLPCFVSLALAVSACAGGVPGSVKPKGSTAPKPGVLVASPTARPGDVAPTGVPGVAGVDPAALIAAATKGVATRTVGLEVAAATIVGKVKVLSDSGSSLISNNGGGVVSNNSGAISLRSGSAIISSNGGNIISSNGGGVIANNGSGYQLLAGEAPVELGLAEAVVTVHDASGQLLVDAAGKPLAAVTDGSGVYRLTAALPPGNLLFKVKLFPNGGQPAAGGEVVAMLARAGETASAAERTVDLDTATTLGSQFVLDRFVKGSQAVFDKLPAAEATRLRDGLAAQKFAKAPLYAPAELVALADDFRQADAAVGKALEDIKVLLIGLTNLGNGLEASKVALGGPRALLFDRQGRLLVAETSFGRIRTVKDGRIGTLADLKKGPIKQSFAVARDLVEAPDGTLYICLIGAVMKVAPDGTVTLFAGGADATLGLDGPAVGAAIDCHRIALAPDGTLYIGESGTKDHGPRVLSVGKDGNLHNVAMPAWGFGGCVNGLAFAPDGTLSIMFRKEGAAKDMVLYRRPAAGGTPVEVAAGFTGEFYSHMGRGPDGMLYITEDQVQRVTAIDADGGNRRVVAGAGGPPDTSLKVPCGLAFGPDGQVFISDMGTNLVYTLGSDKRLTVHAGVVANLGGSDLGAIPMNGPFGAARGPDGAVLITETSGNRIMRFDGASITPFAGVVKGFGGDGGPAANASFNSPKAICAVGPRILVADSANRLLREIGPDGRIASLVGAIGASKVILDDGKRFEASKVSIRSAWAVALSPDGLPYWSMMNAHQVHRLAADGKVEVVAGLAPPAINGFPLPKFEDDGKAAAGVTMSYPTGVAFEPGGDGSLYVAEAAGFRIRKISGLNTKSPTISTFAGRSLPRLLAEPLPALDAVLPAAEAALGMPLVLAFDDKGHMYVGEYGTDNLDQAVSLLGFSLTIPIALPPSKPRIRKIDMRDPAHPVSTIVGPGGKFLTDPDAVDALVCPTGIAVDGQGRLVIVDTGANLVHVLPAGSY